MASPRRAEDGFAVKTIWLAVILALLFIDQLFILLIDTGGRIRPIPASQISRRFGRVPCCAR